MPKPISPRLKTYLLSDLSRTAYRVNIFDITLTSGTVLRYTDGDADVTVNGRLYTSGGLEIGPYFTVSGGGIAARWVLGTSFDTLQFDVIPGNATVAGIPFLTACRQGFFLGATCKVSRVFMPTYGDTRMGPIQLFQGRVAEVDSGRSKATFMINSFLELLDQPFPRNVYQAGCVNNLGDTPCGVNLAALAVAGVVIAGSTATAIIANLTVSPTGNFDQGKVQMTSGAMSGFLRTVKVATGGAPGLITLIYGFSAAPTAGDTFNIYPGCDKTYAGTNGCAKFANQARWRGEDLIPTAETAV